MYLGTDIGGTTARVHAYGGLGELNELGRVEFPVTQWSDGNLEQDFSNLVSAALGLAEQHGPIEGVGLALAGNVDAARTSLTAAGNLGHWVGQPIVARLSAALNSRVVLGNDAEAAALAEALYGHGQSSDFWFIIWGTGVGGCLVRYIKGNPVPLPGELGHQMVKFDSELRCGCGQLGCLEAYCGGGGLANRFCTPAEDLTAEQWREVLGWMRIGVRNVVTSQPVPLVVFGGGVANKQSLLLPGLQKALEEELRIVPPPDVKLSAFGETAGTVGALALLRMM